MASLVCFTFSRLDSLSLCFFFFFFNDTATTEIYTLSLHDALPIFGTQPRVVGSRPHAHAQQRPRDRSEEHTSELQSLAYLVCRLLLEKKKKMLAIQEENIASTDIGPATGQAREVNTPEESEV